MKLTVEQKAEHLRNNGLKCPFCGGTDQRLVSSKIFLNHAKETIECENCGKSYHNIYEIKLVDVKENTNGMF